MKSTADREQKILKLRDDIKKSSAQSRANFEKNWYRNSLFFTGNQWVTWSKSRKSWTKIELKDSALSLPVTNKIAPVVRTIVSVLTQKDPRVTLRPLNSSEESIATANIGDEVKEVLFKESGVETAFKQCATWGVITGNAFVFTYYDNSEEYGVVETDMEQCMSCGNSFTPDEIVESDKSCPKCEGREFGPAMDESGNKITKEFPRGKLKSIFLSPFEVFFDNEIPNFNDVRQVVVSRRRNTDELKAEYADKAENITPDNNETGDLALNYLSSLAYTTDNSSSDFPRGGNSGGYRIDKTTVDEVFSLPTKDFPKGVYAKICSNEVLESGDLWSTCTLEDGTESYFIPIKHFGVNCAPGRPWYRTPVDDLIKKQVQRNKIESLIELNLSRMGSSDWLIPQGSAIDPITGEPGQKITYKPTVGGAKPERIDGKSVNPSFFQFLNIIDNDFEEISSSFDILKGQIPKGLKAFAGLKLLTERGFSNHIEMIRNWEDLIKGVTIHQLEIARKNFTEPRKMMIESRHGSWEEKAFSSADLIGQVEVVVESGSSTPKSQAAEQALILELIEMRIVDIQDPKTKYKIMERIGQVDLMDAISKDVQDANREWKDFESCVEMYEFLEMGQDPTPRMALKLRPRAEVDNHAIHYMEHLAQAKTPEFFKLPKAVQDEWITHLEWHKSQLMAQQAEAAMAGGMADGQEAQAQEEDRGATSGTGMRKTADTLDMQ